MYSLNTPSQLALCLPTRNLTKSSSAASNMMDDDDIISSQPSQNYKSATPPSTFTNYPLLPYYPPVQNDLPLLMPPSSSSSSLQSSKPMIHSHIHSGSKNNSFDIVGNGNDIGTSHQNKTSSFTFQFPKCQNCQKFILTKNTNTYVSLPVCTCQKPLIPAELDPSVSMAMSVGSNDDQNNNYKPDNKKILVPKIPSHVSSVSSTNSAFCPKRRSYQPISDDEDDYKNNKHIHYQRNIDQQNKNSFDISLQQPVSLDDPSLLVSLPQQNQHQPSNYVWQAQSVSPYQRLNPPNPSESNDTFLNVQPLVNIPSHVIRANNNNK